MYALSVFFILQKYGGKARVELYGWGRYPKHTADVASPQTLDDCFRRLNSTQPCIARGLGRSYGDSSLAPHVLETRYLDKFQKFDEATGILTCDAGVSLAEILDVFVPRGWFLAVTPGTRFVTVGGAIASDVHGKNHHRDGTFTMHVTQLEIILGNGACVVTSPSQNSDLFHATCGGMGLTGMIVAASIQLKPIASCNILETTLKLPCLRDVLQAFDEHEKATYSVAWIDCLAKGTALGRSLLMLGEHADDECLQISQSKPISVPIDMPASLLNQASMKLFNTLYYNKARDEQSTRIVAYDTFFYPLDKLSHWNRLYGKAGFVQYQCVLPKAVGEAGLREVLELVSASKRGSFLAVLKVFGASNQNYLSFPMYGYTLALDFKVEADVFLLLNQLDQLVLALGGRVYLCKDARMSEHMFKESYVSWRNFEEVRRKYHAIGVFSSHQSKRLGLQ